MWFVVAVRDADNLLERIGSVSRGAALKISISDLLGRSPGPHISMFACQRPTSPVTPSGAHSIQGMVWVLFFWVIGVVCRPDPVLIEVTWTQKNAIWPLDLVMSTSARGVLSALVRSISKCLIPSSAKVARPRNPMESNITVNRCPAAVQTKRQLSDVSCNVIHIPSSETFLQG